MNLFLSLLGDEPVLAAVIGTIATTLLAKYLPGLHLDATQIAAVASVAAGALGGLARQFTRAKKNSVPTPAAPVPPAQG